MTNTNETAAGLGTGGIDTTFVLFFLALEWGRFGDHLSIDGIVMGVTLLMVLVLPYFLPSPLAKPRLSTWLMGRGGISVVAFILGLGINSLGGTAPAGLQFLPMTLLILSAAVSCFIQFFGVFRLRPVK